MGFREEVAAALEQAVADAGGNQSEAARRMGLKTSVTLRHWMVGARAIVSDAFNEAMNNLGYHLRRGGESQPEARPVEVPAVQQSPMVEDGALRRKIAELEEELVKAKTERDAYEALVLKLAAAKEDAKGAVGAAVKSLSSPA